MAFAVSAEALLLSDTGLYDLEKKSTEVSAKKKTMSDMLSKSELWTFLKVESFIKKLIVMILNTIHLDIIKIVVVYATNSYFPSL